MQIGTSQRVGAMPAIIREGVLRRRQAMDDVAFRNCVKNGIDASDALASLLKIGGCLRLPDQGETIVLTKRVAATASGLSIEGGAKDFSTIIRQDAANAGIDFVDTTESGVDGVYFKGAINVLPTSGASVAFTRSSGGCYASFARNCKFYRVFNAIDINSVTQTRLENIEIRESHGTFGVRQIGQSTSIMCHYTNLNEVICDAPYPYVAEAAQWKGAMGRLTEYSQNHVATSGGNIYQCTTGGTTASGSPPTNQGTAGNRDIADGTVTWRFICSLSLSWILMENFSHSMEIWGGACINGAYGLRVADTAKTTGSHPIWPYLHSWDCDHPAISGILAEAGEDLHAESVWMSSALSGNNVTLTSAYKGEGGFFNCNIRGAAQHGVLHEGGVGVQFIGNKYVDNGQAAIGTYSNHAVGSGVSGFQIIANQFLPTASQLAQNAKYPVVVNAGASDGYVIANNLTRGHATSGVIQDGGTGVNKYVGNNFGF